MEKTNKMDMSEIINKALIKLHADTKKTRIGDIFTFKDLIDKYSSISYENMTTHEIRTGSKYLANIANSCLANIDNSWMTLLETRLITKAPKKSKTGANQYIKTGYEEFFTMTPKKLNSGIFKDIIGLKSKDIVCVTYINNGGTNLNKIVVTMFIDNKSTIIKKISGTPDDLSPDTFMDFINKSESENTDFAGHLVVCDYMINRSNRYDIILSHKYGNNDTNEDYICINERLRDIFIDRIACIHAGKISYNSKALCAEEFKDDSQI